MRPSTAIHNAAVTPAVVARLYSEAETLELEWIGTPLSDDFGSRMIDAALRHLAKVGRRDPFGRVRGDDEQVRFAGLVLRRFWQQNAARDHRRWREALALGRVGRAVSLDELLESGEEPPAPEPAASDEPAGELGRSAARLLELHGWPRRRAWAFVLFHATDCDYRLTCALLAERFEAPVSEQTLRQWNSRYFGRAANILRADLLQTMKE